MNKIIQTAIIAALLKVIILPAAYCGDFGTVASSVTLDSMDVAGNWTLSSGSGDTASLSSVSTPYGSGLKIDYSFGSAGWAQITKPVKYWSLSGTEKLQFYYSKAGSSEKFYVKFKDSDGDLQRYLVGTVADSSGWQRAEILLSSFTADPAGTGNGSFYWAGVQSLEFAFDKSEGGSGTLDVDDILLTADNSTMWDDFEDGADNNLFGGDSGTYQANGNDKVNFVYISTTAYRGTRSREFYYDVTNAGTDWCGAYMSGNKRNMSDANQLRFMIKGAVGGEKLLVELKYNNGATGVTLFQDFIYVSTFSGISGITTQWQQVIIDLTKYQSNMSAIESLNLNVNDQIAAPRSGKVYIDDVMFYNTNTRQSYYLDDMDAPVSNTSWAAYAATTASSKVSSISGFKNGAVRMDYSFGDGTWVVMTRKASVNLSYVKALYVAMKQSSAMNYIELKLKDSSGTVYYHKRLYETMDAYSTVKAPIEDFTFFEGQSGAKLNLREITDVWLTVSRNTKSGSSGSVIFDELMAGTESDFFNDMNPADVMTKVEVVNNPFTPDGDGFKDTARIMFNLSEGANVRLRIYNLKGIIIYEREADFDGASGSFDWEGKDNDGALQRSGLYFYQLFAESITGRSQKFSHIIGIEK